MCCTSKPLHGLLLHGGDSRAVQDQLRNVRQILANDVVFSANLSDGSVVSWGRAAFGGDSSAAWDQQKIA